MRKKEFSTRGKMAGYGKASKGILKPGFNRSSWYGDPC